MLQCLCKGITCPLTCIIIALHCPNITLLKLLVTVFLLFPSVKTLSLHVFLKNK